MSKREAIGQFVEATAAAERAFLDATGGQRVVYNAEIARPRPASRRRLATASNGSLTWPRRLLAKHGYPPDHEERAVELVLQQAELFASSGAAG